MPSPPSSVSRLDALERPYSHRLTQMLYHVSVVLHTIGSPYKLTFCLGVISWGLSLHLYDHTTHSAEPYSVTTVATTACW